MSESFTSSKLGGWGQAPWGVFPWGGENIIEGGGSGEKYTREVERFWSWTVKGKK